MPDRGRPSQFDEEDAAPRARMARYRARLKDGGAPPGLPDLFQHLFLTHDSRMVADSSPAADPAWSVLDDLRDALDAIPAEREEESDSLEAPGNDIEGETHILPREHGA